MKKRSERMRPEMSERKREEREKEQKEGIGRRGKEK